MCAPLVMGPPTRAVAAAAVLAATLGVASAAGAGDAVDAEMLDTQFPVCWGGDGSTTLREMLRSADALVLEKSFHT